MSDIKATSQGTPQSVGQAAAESLANNITQQATLSPDAPAPAEIKQEPKESARFAALAKKEAAFVRRQNEARTQLEAEKATLTKERAEFEAWKAQRAEEDKLWESDPLEGLKRRGFDYDKLTQHVLNQGRPSPDKVAERVAREELQKYKQEQEALAKKTQDEQRAKTQELEQKQFDEALTQFRNQVTEFVKSDGNQEKYELINLYGPQAVEAILATIEQHYQSTLKAGQPKVMSQEEAADLVEKYLEDEGQKITQSKKLAAKAPPQPTEGDKTQSSKAPQRTLNNNLTPSSSAAPTALTREERIKRALSVQL